MSQHAQCAGHITVIVICDLLLIDHSSDTAGIDHAVFCNQVTAGVAGIDSHHTATILQAETRDIYLLRLSHFAQGTAANAKLTTLIAAPSPHLTIGVQSQSMCLPRSNFHNIRIGIGEIEGRDSGRCDVLLRIAPVTQLTLIIAAPRKNHTVDPQSQSEAITRGDLRQCLKLISHIFHDRTTAFAFTISQSHTSQKIGCSLIISSFHSCGGTILTNHYSPGGFHILTQHIHDGHTNLDVVGMVDDLTVRANLSQHLGFILDDNTSLAVDTDIFAFGGAHYHIIISGGSGMIVIQREGIVAVSLSVRIQTAAILKVRQRQNILIQDIVDKLSTLGLVDFLIHAEGIEILAHKLPLSASVATLHRIEAVFDLLPSAILVGHLIDGNALLIHLSRVPGGYGPIVDGGCTVIDGKVT